MSEPFLAEVKIVGFNFPPRGWAECDGQILPINQNQSLYSLLGTTYGGDGRTTFALPDLRGRAPLHPGSSTPLGQKAGQASVALTEAEMPTHGHGAQGTGESQDTVAPNDARLAGAGGGRRPLTPYGAAANLVDMKPSLPAGSSSPHNNMQPYLALNFVIALQGLFPSRN
jgi:microcystin-dependent protein